MTTRAAGRPRMARPLSGRASRESAASLGVFSQPVSMAGGRLSNRNPEFGIALAPLACSSRYGKRVGLARPIGVKAAAFGS